MDEPRVTVRVDKWLWHARFFKTRALAARVVTAGQVRLNGERVAKSARPIGPGDVLTFAQGSRIRVVRVEATGTRRGPASEARTLYTDMSPEERTAEGVPRATRRPDRAERRRAILSKRPPLE